jgi:hypothetical protein
MARPPRNGYTINSDSELLALDFALLPANTPLINFDRKCWGVYQAPEAPVLWTPASTTTALWLDAADSSTITTISSAVSQWNDKSGNARHATQATAGARPSYNTFQLNGKSLVSIRGSGKGMVTGYTLNPPYSIVLLSRNFIGGRVVQGATTNALMCPSRSPNSFFVGADVRSASITNFGEWSTVTMQILGTAPSQLWYNSANIANGSTHGSFSAFNLGAVGAFNENSDCEIAEIIITNSNITTDIRQRIEGYLAHKWGLVANLPSDHPYKIYPPTSGGSFVIAGSLNISSGFEYIPQNSIDAYDLTSITISTNTYSLDLAGATQYISITLAANTTLTILNAGKYTKYFIELIPNGHIIKNFTDIFALPKQYSLATFLTAYFGKQVLELQYINKLYANIDYSDNITPAGAVATVQKINWAAPSDEVLYLAFASSTTAYTGAGISAIAATAGTPSISKSRLLLGSTGRLEATKTSTLDLNETDFTISFFSAKTSLGEYGCIVGSHRSSSIGFYIGVAADSTLFAIFGSNTLSCALPDDTEEHSVIINRIGRVYKVFVDGVLSAHLKAANNFNNNSTEPLCIGSLKNAVGTPSWTSQSWQGYLRQLTINTAASIPFSANDVPPKDTLTASTVLLLKYNVSDADFAQYTLSRSFTSNVTVQPLIASGRLNKYSHIGYTDSSLEITGDVTLEAKIFNPSGNTRGAIIDVEGGFTWGIYDLKLRITFGSFTLDGVTDIPDSTVVDVSFVKSGTNCSLFLNGELEATATTSEVMNAASSSSEFSIKRLYSQDSSVAAINTSLFRSRSWIEISQLRVTKSARYTGNYIPDVFYGQ